MAKENENSADKSTGIPQGSKSSANDRGGSAENQSQASGSNAAHGHSKPSEPGMTPGIGEGAARAEIRDEQLPEGGDGKGDPSKD